MGTASVARWLERAALDLGRIPPGCL